MLRNKQKLINLETKRNGRTIEMQTKNEEKWMPLKC